jgi:hypothetical protein
MEAVRPATSSNQGHPSDTSIGSLRSAGYCPLLFEFRHRSHESFGLEVEFTRLELLFIPTIRIPSQSLLTVGAASV